MINPILRNTCLPAALVLLGTAARAQTFIATNTTLNATNPITGNVSVGYANQNDFNNGTNPTSPIVNLVSGGSVSGYLEAFTSSIINVSGGSVGTDLAAFSNSTVNLSGGNVNGYLEAVANGTLNLFGMGLTATPVNSSISGFSQYSLSGKLSDGTLLVNKTLLVQNGGTARYTLNNVAAVPEPGFFALLMGAGMTGAGFLVHKRRVHK